MSTAFWEARKAAAVAELDKVEAAILSLQLEIESYTVDTGQTRQTVKQQDLAVLNNKVDILVNRIRMYDVRINGSGGAIVRPGW